MPSEPYEIKGYCGKMLHGKTWSGGTTVECDSEEVKLVMYPKRELGSVPGRICEFCRSRLSASLRREPE